MNYKMSIQWHIWNVCNIACSYCTYKKKRGTKQLTYPNKVQFKTVLMHLLRLNRPEYEIRYMGSGGEPTLHPNLLDFIKMSEDILGTKCIRNSILTNGVKDIEYFSRLKSRTTHYNISVHSEFVENHHVIDLVTGLTENNNVHINIMYLPRLRDKCKSLVDAIFKLHNSYIFTSRVVYVRAEPNFTELLPSYTEEDIDYIKSTNKELLKVQNNDDIYWELDDFCKDTWCVMGGNVLRIREDGAFSGSSCLLANYSKESLYNRNLREGLSSCIRYGQCNQLRCASDIHLSCGTKYKTEQEAKDYVECIRKYSSENSLENN